MCSMFVGWEGVGLCSYLLIGFWYTRQSATEAGKKAFIVNRIGDFGFLLAILLLFMTFQTADMLRVQEQLAQTQVEAGACSQPLRLLLFMGAVGKSAQVPLYVWLPDAMEGPTPVSALIHAATMVTAGVYMIARSSLLFTMAPVAAGIVAFVGIATALFAATIALVATDIKRVPGVLHGQPVGLYGVCRGARGVCRGDLSPGHARLLQSPVVSWSRGGHPCPGR